MNYKSLDEVYDAAKKSIEAVGLVNMSTEEFKELLSKWVESQK